MAAAERFRRRGEVDSVRSVKGLQCPCRHSKRDGHTCGARVVCNAPFWGEAQTPPRIVEGKPWKVTARWGPRSTTERRELINARFSELSVPFHWAGSEVQDPPPHSSTSPFQLPRLEVELLTSWCELGEGSELQCTLAQIYDLTAGGTHGRQTAPDSICFWEGQVTPL
ncbi:hypothetical protein SKAU_G00180880 [Synaphobranchus kaupii]|uniref:Uncharacterized protein n=1 Tax=Synaphobranchus kaupii TaxID=118154 RepID=A0A9Q1J1B3_SYNKA|nr:hypothetical protein SKAU_G00180880 [Synaphobranchus kaupii]